MGFSNFFETVTGWFQQSKNTFECKVTETSVPKKEQPEFRIKYKRDQNGKWWWRIIQDGGKIFAQSSKGYDYAIECINDARTVLNLDNVHTEKGLPEGII
ncbi:MAG: hypothetical protein ABSG99_02835 [Sedimentisphaerales bacterium]